MDDPFETFWPVEIIHEGKRSGEPRLQSRSKDGKGRPPFGL